MTSFSLLISDAALRHAILEQIEARGSVSFCENFEKACATKSDVLIAAAKDLPPLLQKEAPALLFVIGEEVPSSWQDVIAETFPLPLRLGHFTARLQLHVTAQQQMADTCWILSPYRFSARARTLTRDDGTSLKLTEKEAALLACLAQSPEALSRDEILAEIWGYDGQIDTHTLETHVSRLRSLPDWREIIVVKDGRYQINPSLMQK